MSIQVMSLIWKHAKVSGSELLVLLALADYGNDDGKNIFPSLKKLGEKARLSEDQARRILKNLEKKKLIRLVEMGGWRDGRNWANEYELLINNVVQTGLQDATSLQDATTLQDATSPRRRNHRGSGNATTVPAQMQPQSPLEPPIEPSVGEKGRKPAPVTGPACTVYRDVFRSNPTKAQAPIIEARVSDLEVWRAACEAWALKRYNPGNVAGILDWYENPDRIAASSGPPSHANGRPSKNMNAMVATAELVQEYRSAK